MEDSYRFFENRACRYFPCHEGLSDFNCLFCYCPLYGRIPCPGTPEFVRKPDGTVIKKCTGCTFPHRPENYERIMRLLKPSASGAAPIPEPLHGGTGGADSLDFSVSVNPLGMPGTVRAALAGLAERGSCYPDYHCAALRAALSRRYGLPSGMICVGNGASELIALAVAAIEPRTALLLAPTFSGYERALAARHTELAFCPLRREEQFSFGGRFATEFFALLQKQPDMVFLCQPNNPTGTCMEPELLHEIARRCEQQGTFLVVDECFLGFVRGAERLSARKLLASYRHVLVIDAATKLYAIPGIRLGWGFGSDMLLARMRQLQPEWSVSEAAQLAGLAALQDESYLGMTLAAVEAGRNFLAEELGKLSCTVYPGQANFLLWTAPRNIAEQLRRADVCVRSCAGFRGLGACDYRIAVRPAPENQRLVVAVREALGAC